MTMQPSSNTQSARTALIVAALVIGADQASKLLAMGQLELHRAVEVMPGFNLFLTQNTGVSFSFLQGLSPAIVTLVNLLVLAVVIWFWRREPRPTWVHHMAFGAIMGGAIGNIIDRVRLGYVIDFISLYAFDWYFAIFNIADTAITLGAILLVVNLFLAAAPDERIKD